MADRNFSKAFEIGRSSPVFNYIYDNTIASGNQTGWWRPMNASDFGDISVTQSGVFNMESAEIVEAIASGNSYKAPFSRANTTGFASNILVKNSAGTLCSINGYSNYTGIQYVHVYDNTNSGDGLVSVVAVDAANNFSIDYGSNGIIMNSGIFICNSLSPVVQQNGSDNIYIVVSYK